MPEDRLATPDLTTSAAGEKEQRKGEPPLPASRLCSIEDLHLHLQVPRWPLLCDRRPGIPDRLGVYVALPLSLSVLGLAALH